MTHVWHLLPEQHPEAIAHLQEKVQLPRTLAKLLVDRGVFTFEDAKAFFRPDFLQVHDPFMMADMEQAAKRVVLALERKERILIYGDYDVDGTTSVALVYGFLSNYTDQLLTYIPDRHKEGYGLSYAGIDFAADHEVSLVIALDCGVKAIDQVAYGNKLGLEFIICDHHNPGEQLPEALVLDPKRVDCQYPYKELSGCGVGFKLCQAILMLNGESIKKLVPLLDLLAVSIAADIVPMTGENRVLAHFGLQQFNTTPRPGFRALLGQFNPPYSITDVVFKIAPRINAAGRIDHGLGAVELLVETDPQRAQLRADAINTNNTDRKQLDEAITRAALQQMEELGLTERRTTVVYHPEWHKGVIGIVASRLIERHYKPTVVLTMSNGKLAGSARSVRNFDLYEALEAASDALIQFGGHKYAAGMTLHPEQLEHFRLRFEEEVAKRIQPEHLTPVLEIDAEIRFDELTPKFLRVLDQFEPFGPGNLPPLFVVRNLEVITCKTMGEEGKHWKCQLRDMESTTLRTEEAVWFGKGEELKQWVQPGIQVDAAFHLSVNRYQGTSRLQLNLRDLVPAGSKKMK